MVLHKYWSSACPRCAFKAKCTTGEFRRIARWEHETVLEAMEVRLSRMPEASRIRRQTADHVFGTLKSWDGIDALPDETTAECANADEPACPSLQSEACDADLRSQTADQSHPGLNRAVFITRCRPNE